MTLKQASDALSHLAHAAASGTGDTDADYCLRYQHGSTSSAAIASADTDEYVLMFRAEKAGSMVDARVSPNETQAAGANSRSIEVVKNDGAGGADTLLGTKIDGTASTVTKAQVSDLAMVEGTSTFAAGDYIWLKLTKEGTGQAAVTYYQCSFTYRYD